MCMFAIETDAPSKAARSKRRKGGEEENEPPSWHLLETDVSPAVPLLDFILIPPVVLKYFN